MKCNQSQTEHKFLKMVFLFNRSGELKWSPKFVSKRPVFEILIILWVSSKLGEITAKFAYILLSQGKNDCFGHSRLITSMSEEKLAEGVSHVPCLVCNYVLLNKITLLLCLIGIFKLRVFKGHLQLFHSIVTTYHCDGWSWL